LAIINKRKPDIALLDIEMPKHSGIEVIERKDSPTKVIFLSAYEEQSLIRRCIDLGAKGYLLKKWIGLYFKSPLELITLLLFLSTN